MLLDLLVRNARIVTVDRDRTRGSSIGIWNGRIVGLDEQLDGVGARVELDARGAAVVPGFHDAHCHTTSFGMQLALLDLAGVVGAAATIEAVSGYAAGLPPGAWVIGMGYGGGMPFGAHLRREQLDLAGGGRPVWLTHFSGHQGVVSSAVLERIGRSDAAGQVTRGRIDTDPAGRPTGLLEESAMDLVKDHVGQSSVEQLARAIDAGTRQYAAEGITSFADAGIGCPGMDHSQVELAAYQLARETGRLHARAQLMAHNEMLHELSAHPDDGISRGLDLGVRTGFGDSWLSLGAMKIWVDGLGAEGDTASDEEYFDNDPAILRRDIIAAHRAGWQVAAHAMGDRALDLVLDALAEATVSGPVPAGPDAPRHRVEHGALIRRDQIVRLVRAEMSVATQPIFIAEFGDLFADVVGPDRMAEVLRVRSLLAAGVPVAGSSDRPVAGGEPLRGIQAMVRRESATGNFYAPDEAVDAATALEAFTLGGARLARAEHVYGRLAPRLAADLVLLSDDPTAVPADRISSIAVLATMAGGEVTHDPDGLLAGAYPA